ncbi:transposase [Streptomyces canus]|uniref:transposase n=1 Tax=Streptomyces canus TaxID=58343 RepID=UPI003F4D36D0
MTELAQDNGCKRSIVTDALGLLLTVLFTAASAQESVAGIHLLDKIATTHASICRVRVDGGYRKHLVEHAATSSCTAAWPATTRPSPLASKQRSTSP